MATAIRIRVFVIVSELTWWWNIQVPSRVLNQCVAPYENVAREPITTIQSAAYPSPARLTGFPVRGLR